MAETRPRPRRTGSKNDKITASAPERKKPPIRIEIDRDALAAINKRTVAAQLGIGLAAGWLASWVVGGSGLIRYVATGLIGAFVGGYLLDKLGLELGIKNPVVARIVMATIGASLVVLLARILA
ncbi:MAG TPA: GlsB/YeaQ/YmgE family stress response membrane protein [Sphingomicrobium sp.]|nr:GlsB/YeaQ/YmgE family stress response membrane protein [Sphingomicrobium sp.]